MTNSTTAPTIRRLDPWAQVDLRLDRSDRALVERVGHALGLSLPTIPNSAATNSHGSRTALWLGPDEWLILGYVDAGDVGQSSIPDLLRAIADEVATIEDATRLMAKETFASTVDVSANRIAIEVVGASARDLLAFGCALDLGDRAFPAGRCAETNLARANVILWRDAPEVWRILVRPSYAPYLDAWLEDALDGLL